MGVIKISNSKSDLQGHSRALAMLPFDRPQTIPIRLPYSNYFACTANDILSLISQHVKRSRDSKHIPFRINHACIRTPLYQSVHKFELPSFTNYKYMIGVNLKKRVTWLWERPF